jgi:NAD(P)-dependent dehydrogenase (short-subunit alcohol dehydrogenase family)
VSKRWIVTGGSRGLGLAVARIARERGDRVAVLARRSDPRMHEALGADALFVETDVTQADGVSRSMETVAREFGGVDVLVNNAGLHRGGKVDRLSLEDWDAVLATNLSGPLHCVRAVLPHMGEGGSIVNVGAVVGLRGFPGDSMYGASKAGLAGLTQVLAAELARRSIRVNLVIPGFVLTDMTSEVNEKAQALLKQRIPLGRFGTEEEIAQVICWVAGSTYMTGAIVPTDGGMLCQL